jgi:hypothetical protein
LPDLLRYCKGCIRRQRDPGQMRPGNVLAERMRPGWRRGVAVSRDLCSPRRLRLVARKARNKEGQC